MSLYMHAAYNLAFQIVHQGKTALHNHRGDHQKKQRNHTIKIMIVMDAYKIMYYN